MKHDIETAARIIVSRDGATSLSLTKISHEVGVTPPALYHHYENGLDDIIYALAKTVVHEIVREQRNSISELRKIDISNRILSATRSFRQWCIQHPNEFHLIFGTSPLLSSNAQTAMAGMWMRELGTVWGSLFQDLWNQKPFPILADEDIDPKFREQLQVYLEDTGIKLPLGAVIVFLLCWNSIYGSISIELMGHLPAITDHLHIFELMLSDLFEKINLEYHPENDHRENP